MSTDVEKPESDATKNSEAARRASHGSTLSLLGDAERTGRGFQYITFPDAYGHECSIQQSSAIDDTERGYEHPGSSFLWIGPDEADPKIMASQAD